MATKKIKTFTVDEDIYNALVSMFKEYGADVSISYYLDGCLKDLLKYLRTLDDLRKREPEKIHGTDVVYHRHDSKRT